MVEIQAFGDHLRSDEDVERALAESVQDAFQRMLATGGVLVHARDPGIGKKFPEFLLDLLRSEAEHAQPCAPAVAADNRGGILAAAVVAPQLVLLLVVREAHVAVLALGYPAAGFTLPHGNIAPPVLENDDLFLLFQRLLDRRDQRRREMTAHLFPAIGIAQVNTRYDGHRHIAEPRAEVDPTVFVGGGIVLAFHAGCRRAEQGLRTEQ